MSAEGGNRAIVAALLANTGIAITKLLAFLLTGASSMLAEAIHSVADSGNQLLLLLGGKRARREATPEHPFGYGRERYVYGFLVSIVLFTVGGLFALYEAYHKLHEVRAADGHPEGSILDSTYWWVPILVLLIAIGLEGSSFRTAMKESAKLKGTASYVQFVRRAKQPELPVILLEDAAALTGLVFALLGIGLSLLTGSEYFDVAGTAMIGLLLVVVAVVLGDRDQEPAARRGGLGRRPAPDPRRARGDRGDRLADPPQDPAPRAGGAAGGGQDRGAGRRHRGRRRRGHRCGGGRRAGVRADGPGDLPRAGHPCARRSR